MILLPQSFLHRIRDVSQTQEIHFSFCFSGDILSPRLALPSTRPPWSPHCSALVCPSSEYLEAFTTCPRQWQSPLLSFRLNARSVSPSLRPGKHIHSSIEYYEAFTMSQGFCIKIDSDSTLQKLVPSPHRSAQKSTFSEDYEGFTMSQGSCMKIDRRFSYDESFRVNAGSVSPSLRPGTPLKCVR